jgi:hypothetical protein
MISSKNIKVYTNAELRDRIREGAHPTGVLFAYKQSVPSRVASLIPIKNRLGSVEPIICQVVAYHAKGSVRKTRAVIEVITSQMETHYTALDCVDGFIELSTAQMKTILTMDPEDQFNLVTKLFTHSKLYSIIENRNNPANKNKSKDKANQREFLQQLENKGTPTVEKSVLQVLQTLREEMIDRIERLGVQVARLSVSIGELQAEMHNQTEEVKSLTAPLVDEGTPSTSDFKNLPPQVKKMRIHDLILQAKELQRRMDDMENTSKKTSVEMA